jgi:hypothetical protein
LSGAPPIAASHAGVVGARLSATTKSSPSARLITDCARSWSSIPVRRSRAESESNSLPTVAICLSFNAASALSITGWPISSALLAPEICTAGSGG